MLDSSSLSAMYGRPTSSISDPEMSNTPQPDLLELLSMVCSDAKHFPNTLFLLYNESCISSRSLNFAEELAEITELCSVKQRIGVFIQYRCKQSLPYDS